MSCFSVYGGGTIRLRPNVLVVPKDVLQTQKALVRNGYKLEKVGEALHYFYSDHEFSYRVIVYDNKILSVSIGLFHENYGNSTQWKAEKERELELLKRIVGDLESKEYRWGEISVLRDIKTDNVSIFIKYY